MTQVTLLSAEFAPHLAAAARGATLYTAGRSIVQRGTDALAAPCRGVEAGDPDLVPDDPLVYL